MKLLTSLLIVYCARTVLLQSCADPPIVSTDYNFQPNVTQISGSIGSFIRVQCIADPTTDVTSYVWQKNGENIQDPSIIVYLTIRSLQVEDGGQYRCAVMTASCGTIYSPEVSINTPPDVVTISGPSSVSEGQSVQLTCSANGWPPPSYEWSLNGTFIGTESEYRVVSASTSDAGEYTCLARNSRGQISETTSLTVVEVTVEATSTLADTASVDQVSSSTTSNPPLSLMTSMATKGTTQTLVPQSTTTTTTQETSPTTLPPPDDSSSSSSDNIPTAPFIVLLAVATAMIVALVGIICIVFVLVVCMIVKPSRNKRREIDRKRLLEEEQNGMEMTDRVINDEDSNTSSARIIQEKSHISYVNIAFGKDSEEEEEEEKEVGGSGSEVLVSGEPEMKSSSSQKLSPQRYQQSSKPVSPSKNQPPPSGMSHSISMDVPNTLATRPPKKGGRVPRSKSLGEPGQLKMARHLAVPVDKHKVSRKKESKSGKKHGKTSRASAPPTSGKLYTKSLTDMDKVQLLAASDTEELLPSADQAQVSNATVLTVVSMEEESQEGETLRNGEATAGNKDETKGAQEEREEGNETMQTSYIGTVEENEEEEEEAVVVVQEKLGEASVTFEQEGTASELFRDEGLGAMVSSGEEEEEEEEGEGPTGGVEETVGEELVEEEETGEGDKEKLLKKEDEEEGVKGPSGGVVETEVEGPSGGVVETEVEGPSGGVVETEVEGPSGGVAEDKEGEEPTRGVADGEEGKGLTRGAAETGEGDKEKLLKEEEDVVGPDIHRMSVFVEKAKKMGRSVSFVAQLDKSHPLNSEDIQRLVEEAMAGGKGNTLTLEYKNVPHNSVQTLPLTAEEKHKNRYRNVLPNPHSAVRLTDTGVAGSTYINANYIRGYGEKEKQYIATQGPTNNTVPDFWRMVWEKDVSIIVMTTSLVERGNQKCVKYWPSDDDSDTAIYGNMVVRNNYEEVTEFYTISYLSVHPQSPEGEETAEERDVYHFWYTVWSDFSVPKETGSILQLREAVDACRVPQSGPVVVHCSAGLGRSGTFMAIDMGIQQCGREGTVDPLKYMCEMRQDRGGIIQTPDQYIYIHRVLKDYMAS